MEDSGARHQGQNGDTTRIGNDYFAWFQTTERQDRRNFLQRLHGDAPAYVINAAALDYSREQKRPQQPLNGVSKRSPGVPRGASGARTSAGLRHRQSAPRARGPRRGLWLSGLYEKGLAIRSR